MKKAGNAGFGTGTYGRKLVPGAPKNIDVFLSLHKSSMIYTGSQKEQKSSDDPTSRRTDPAHKQAHTMPC